MRSFSFDTITNRAMLNGRPYYMRGTNVCIFRFFEDPDRELLPWDENWVVRLHQQFKNMHWNSMRYCIGLPPARWYDIADSLGFLIQNEYPVWTGGPRGFERIYPNVTAEHLANEYRAWLPEHWNHPSVVIWDAQNESVTEITGEAINMVREMDLSNRPWENGWSAPQASTDPIESHPYLFSEYRRPGVDPPEKGPLSKLYTVHIPGNDANDRYRPKEENRYNNPIIINEYAWIWLNRDGSTTTLTDRVYDVLFGKDLTTEQRLYLYARHLGIKTEYWRAHRLCAGVLHFCGLAYSRSEEPRGQTSDHFIDIKNLEYEPQFVKYVKPSFAPVGLMVNFWDNTVSPNQKTGIEVYVINDLDENWSGPLKLTLLKDEKMVSSTTKELNIPNLERLIITFPIEMPFESGEYRLEAEINFQGESVKSIREFKVGNGEQVRR
jgi:beta-galactosidase